ncbi:MAG: winged helix-turn-helix transcriptional regulator [Desulfobacterales bacterium]|nr:MAG: winged helix-turn-helix transcriptional regulator [Desulfobacterales bacterium]
MPISTKGFFVLDALDDHEITNQRQLSERSGINLGHVNYVLKDLLKRGLVRSIIFIKALIKKGMCIC